MRYARAIILLHSFVKISLSLSLSFYFARASARKDVCRYPSLNKRLFYFLLLCKIIISRQYSAYIYKYTHTHIHIGVSLNSHCCVSSKGRGCRSIGRHALSSCNNDGSWAPLCNSSLRHRCSFLNIFYIARWNALLSSPIIDSWQILSSNWCVT